MNLFDIILSTEVIAGILIAASLAMAVRSILFFTREAATMSPKLQKIEHDLSKLREGMDEKKKAVKDLTTIVDPLKLREARLRSYYEAVKNLELDYDRKSEAEAEKAEQERQKRVQRKKMGFD